jgi:hypothetical protein
MFGLSPALPFHFHNTVLNQPMSHAIPNAEFDGPSNQEHLGAEIVASYSNAFFDSFHGKKFSISQSIAEMHFHHHWMIPQDHLWAAGLTL